MKDFTDEEFKNLDGLIEFISEYCDDSLMIEAVKKYAETYHSAKINRLNRCIPEHGTKLKIFTNEAEYNVTVVDVCSNGAAFCTGDDFEGWVPKIIISD